MNLRWLKMKLSSFSSFLSQQLFFVKTFLQSSWLMKFCVLLQNRIMMFFLISIIMVLLQNLMGDSSFVAYAMHSSLTEGHMDPLLGSKMMEYEEIATPPPAGMQNTVIIHMEQNTLPCPERFSTGCLCGLATAAWIWAGVTGIVWLIIEFS